MNKKERTKTIIGGAIGNCVHVAGVYEYLRIAENFGYRTIFLGAAVEAVVFIHAIEKNDPKIVCLSYRLTADNLEGLLKRFFDLAIEKDLINGRIFYFGGTQSCIDVARKFPYFNHFFKGEESFAEIGETLFVQSQIEAGNYGIYERLPVNSDKVSLETMRKIIEDGRYLPMVRHHFGLPSLDETIEGIKKISESGQLDLISLGPDQNAQEFFFEPEKMNQSLDGSGGVPLRTEEDLKRIWQATQCGNFPRLRIYAGTRNLLKWAEMSVRTINTAWGTIPLFWYSLLDGRSKRPVEDAIRENMEVIRWYAERGIPVEVNDSHQWSLRDASDAIAVADFYLAAYNAKKLGVKTYIAQFMFNTPRLSSGKMDLAKMLAKWEMISRLEDDHFICLREVRAGLTHFSIDQDVAKGQLAASTLLAFALKPQILHVVSFSEADHAATADDVIESCKIVRGVVRNSWRGFPDLTLDKEVISRKNHLIKEAEVILNGIRSRFGSESDDPLSDPRSLVLAIESGILDAPQLKNNPIGLGRIRTMPVNGGYDAVDELGHILPERMRLQMLLGYTKDQEK
jgi:hypothetical protein